MLRVVDLATDEGDQRFRQIRTRLLNRASPTRWPRSSPPSATRAATPPTSTRWPSPASLVAMLAHVAAHRYGFEFWGIKTADVREAMARKVYWGITGQKPPAA